MANSFGSIDDCVSWYKLESGSLTADSKGSNTLVASASAPTADTTNKVEGASSASFARASAQYYSIADSSLTSDFPLKSGNSNKKLTWCFWYRQTASSNGAYYDIIAKSSSSTTAKRSLAFYTYGTSTSAGTMYIHWGYTTNSASYACGTFATNIWYHIGIIVDGDNGVLEVRIWNASSSTVSHYTHRPGTVLAVNDGEFAIGRHFTATNYFNGQIDEVVIFKDCLSVTDIDTIRAQTCTSLSTDLCVSSCVPQVAYREHFLITGLPVQVAYLPEMTAGPRNVYCVDPVSGNNSNTGLSWTQPWLSIQNKVLGSGDVVYVKKSSESNLSGTVTATTAGVTVTTTSNLTGELAAYDVVRFDTDDDISLVKTVASDSIVLHRPYRGTSGSGKTLKKLTVISTTASTWDPSTSMNYVGTSWDDPNNYVQIVAGWDPSTATQNGFTVLGGSGTGYGFTNGATGLWFQRLGFYYYGNNWFGDFAVCKFTKCYSFRGANDHMPGTIWLSQFDGFYMELSTAASAHGFYTTLNDCEVNSLEVFLHRSDCDVFYNVTLDGSTFRNCKFGFNRNIFFCSGSRIQNLLLEDCTLGENWTNAYSFRIGTGGSRLYAVMRNCLVNDTWLGYDSSGLYMGELSFENYNCVADDHRTYYGSRLMNTYGALLTLDATTYRTTSPSVKIVSNGGFDPVKVCHGIPCNAGLTKNISVYFRKNAAYTSPGINSLNALPKMRIKWPTGTTPNVVWNTHDVTMTDVVDTWNQVSYSVAPSLKGTIEVEMNFHCSVTDGTMWYDDFEVTD